MTKNNDSTYYATLVQNNRKGNQVKQIFIKYIGSIRQRHIPYILGRIAFWEKAERRLAALSLEEKVLHSIMKVIEKKVPKPKQAELDQFEDFISKRQKEDNVRENHIEYI